jgi:hypothetical protein
MGEVRERVKIIAQCKALLSSPSPARRRGIERT